jgi:Mrp family chromosome partitioning ATPase
VIVDLSPLAAGVDARLSAAFIDSYLLVVKWGQTTTHLVQHALYNAPEMQGSILGVILNQVDLKQLSTYDGIHAKYRYGNSRYNFA